MVVLVDNFGDSVTSETIVETTVLVTNSVVSCVETDVDSTVTLQDSSVHVATDVTVAVETETVGFGVIVMY